MKRFLMHILAAACLAASAGTACANASSSATFGSLVITLTDLNPHDGIAPSLSFSANGHAYVLGETLGWGETEEESIYAYTAAQQQGVLSGHTHGDWSSASSSVAAADTLAGFTALSASGGAASGLDGHGAYRSHATGSDPFLNSFILSANTRVTFSTTAAMSVQTSMGYNLDADQDEYANAHMLLAVNGSVDGIDQSDVQERQLSATFAVRDDGSTMGVRDSWSGLLTASFSNTSALDAYGTMQAFVSTEGWSANWDGVTPVPEPETWAMLLAGLALVGAASRRKAI
ncbi:PEPxxWA-CTERM sorting domain-containing protein [Duganella radicis]|uniref:PEPxxWA-CTERM sorting domain-containing protein n=1 Tax=Duganella radicis TaxID=551988 RepID=A0A6L6PH14_9BURK|nr:PEPxxWA-CTERM sorting domain-containing protein [Duganella radicis]MTV38283.1 PEPxxWA-CTERM sorting domain-containing protein [Duganella radicis]